MNIEWYVLRTICGREEISYLTLQKIFTDFDVIYPRRRVSWRKNGRLLNLVRPMFEGYLFVSTNKILMLDYLLRKLQINIAWIIRSAGGIVPISTEEKGLIQQLINSEGIAEVSELERIKDQLTVVKGPLVGLENAIKKFSGRNRRIIIEVPILGEKRKVELEGHIINSEQK